MDHQPCLTCMYVHPIQDGDSGLAKVHLVVANPSDTEYLVIRKGQPYARLTQVTPYSDDQVTDQDIATASLTQSAPATVAASLKKLTDEGVLDDLDEDDPLHNKSAHQIISMVDEGFAFIKGMNYKSWLEIHGPHIQFGPRTPEERKHQCQKLLYAFNTVVTLEKKPGTINVIQHEINLVDKEIRPVKCSLRRYSPVEMQAIADECEKLLAADIIEPCNSPWAAPIVMVKKKDNTYRMCIDYRVTINPVCVNDSYPLPKISVLLDKIGRAKELSMFDLCCGYWQILVRESDKKYLAFTTESHGLMTFKRAPFGMLTSGNTFQRAIDLILEKDCNGRVLHNIASSYSDDGAVYSTTNDHIDDLTRVLKLLKKGGAVLGLKKCI